METLGEFEYNKKDLIGHGAFAVVFKGRHKQKHDKTVAVKCITKKNLPKSQSLLSKEIKILKELSDLNHENVVALLDCKETTHHVYLIMEYCNGGDMADFLQIKGTLSEDTISSFLRQIAGAMCALHDKGVVHRDLKPQNLLLCCPDKTAGGKPASVANAPTLQAAHTAAAAAASPQEIRIKIADFGFARFLQDGVMAATLCGSPMYMAPEVIMSLQYDAKADLWSIGTIIYQCLTGKAPFQASTPQQLRQFYEKHADLAPNIPNQTSEGLRDLLMRLLKRNAKDRIDFDDFLNHPFIQPKTRQQSPPDLSNPLPIPNPTGNSPRLASESPLSSCTSADTPRQASPARLAPNRNATARVSDSPGYERIDHPEPPDPLIRDSPTGRESPLPSDFVLIPEGLPPKEKEALERERRLSSASPVRKPPTPNTGLTRIPSVGTDGRMVAAASPHVVNVSPGSGVASYQSTNIALGRPGSPQTGNTVLNTPPTAIAAPSAVVGRQRSGSTPIPSRPVALNTHDRTGISPLGHLPPGSLSPPRVEFNLGTPPRVRGASACSPDRGYLPQPAAGLAQMAPHGMSPGRLHTMLGGFQHTNVVHTVASDQNIAGLAHIPMLTRSPTEPPSYFGLHRQQSATNPTQGVSPGHTGTTGLDIATPRRSLLGATNTQSSPVFAQSPPNMEGPVQLIAPPLEMETVLNAEHNETLAKLSFVQVLVECVMELAQSRSSPLVEDVSRSRTNVATNTNDVPFGAVSFLSEEQRRFEQLMLYLQCLHYLNAAMQLAQEEIAACRLHPSTAVKQVLRSLNEHYGFCLDNCKQLDIAQLLQCDNIEASTSTADRLMYEHAIEMCQSAALDELFGSPQECFHRYHHAQILFHALASKATTESDKETLQRYKELVEKRLFSLQERQLVGVECGAISR